VFVCVLFTWLSSVWKLAYTDILEPAERSLHVGGLFSHVMLSFVLLDWLGVIRASLVGWPHSARLTVTFSCAKCCWFEHVRLFFWRESRLDGLVGGLWGCKNSPVCFLAIYRVTKCRDVYSINVVCLCRVFFVFNVSTSRARFILLCIWLPGETRLLNQWFSKFLRLWTKIWSPGSWSPAHYFSVVARKNKVLKSILKLGYWCQGSSYKF